MNIYVCSFSYLTFVKTETKNEFKSKLRQSRVLCYEKLLMCFPIKGIRLFAVNYSEIPTNQSKKYMRMFLKYA